MDYKPIDCGFHDLLLDRATRGNTVQLRFRDTDGMKTCNQIIIDVYTEGNEEFLRTKEGTIIRLDRVIAVDGIMNPSALPSN